MVRLSGLWKNTGKDGKTFLSGTLNPGAKLLVMSNSFKKKETDPDYFAYLAASEKKAETKPEAAAGDDGL